MREIKFRAWDKEFKMMSKPMEVFKNGQSFFFFQGIGTRCPNHESSIIMQFTGLKDKNGVEIYHKDFIEDGYGNILLVDFWRGQWVLVHEPTCRAEIEGECKFDSLYDYSDTIEVIGNIYDEANNSLANKSNL